MIEVVRPSHGQSTLVLTLSMIKYKNMISRLFVNEMVGTYILLLKAEIHTRFTPKIPSSV